MNEKGRGRPTGPGAAPSSSNHDHPMSDLGTQSMSNGSSLVVDAALTWDQARTMARPLTEEGLLAPRYVAGTLDVAPDWFEFEDVPDDVNQAPSQGFVLDLENAREDVTDQITGFPTVLVADSLTELDVDDHEAPAFKVPVLVFATGDDPRDAQVIMAEIQGEHVGGILRQIADKAAGSRSRPYVTGTFADVLVTAGDQTRRELGFIPLTPAEDTRTQGAFRTWLANWRAKEIIRREEEARRQRMERLIREREEWYEADQIARERREAAKLAEAGGSLEPLNWTELFAEDYSKANFLPGKLLETGQQIALVGDGKAGKSLLVVDWCYHAVTGRTFLDGPDDLKPIRVLYLDAENNRSDLWMRLRSLGARPDELEGLVYLSFPALNPLDTTAGAAQVMDLVGRYEPDAVVIDTVSRFISGNENDADTWLALYRHLHRALKADGVAGIRLDHFGKDSTAGSRGSSAKSQDIDHVWELTAGVSDQAKDETGTTVRTPLRLKRTHTRTGLGPDDLDILRVGRKTEDAWVPGGTSHQVRAALDPFQVPETLVADAGLAARICEYLADHPDGASTSRVEREVDGRAEDIRKALRELEASGNLATARGPRGARIYRLARSFGEAS